MKRVLLLHLFLLSFCTAQHTNVVLPDGLKVCGGRMHVQGIAIDTARQCVYFSFTTSLIRTDYEGRVLGSVEHIPGHLGAIALNTSDGSVYASLEYKDDEIGRGIARQTGVADYSRQNCTFSIAVFNGPAITQEGMTMDDGVLRTVRLDDVARDYCDSVYVGNSLLPHRYACSGIDGICFAPAPGHKGGRKYLYVAYGIYGDTSRTDNDCQVILRFNIDNWTADTRSARPEARYFVPTGNTTYGVQNMAYDNVSGTLLLAVYRGSKPQYPNFDLYGVDLTKRARKAHVKGIPYEPNRVKTHRLTPHGEGDGPIHGWRYRWGSTGLAPVDEGRFLLSENSRMSDGTQCCTLHLVHFTPDSIMPFSPAEGE